MRMETRPTPYSGTLCDVFPPPVCSRDSSPSRMDLGTVCLQFVRTIEVHRKRQKRLFGACHGHTKSHMYTHL